VTESFPRPRYASWAIRVVAFVIDMIPVGLIMLVGDLLFAPGPVEVTRQSGNFTYLVSQQQGLGVSFFAFAFLGATFSLWNQGYRQGTIGKSLGKQIMKISTVSADTQEPLGISDGMLRWVLIWLDFAICYIGVLWPLWNPNHQTLIGDRFAKSIVIRR